MSPPLRSRAWVADGVFARHTGFLELHENLIRFVASDGQQIFSSTVHEAQLKFPLRLLDGVIVSLDDGEHTVLFSDPYVEWSAGSARATRRQWRKALGELQNH